MTQIMEREKFWDFVRENGLVLLKPLRLLQVGALDVAYNYSPVAAVLLRPVRQANFNVARCVYDYDPDADSYSNIFCGERKLLCVGQDRDVCIDPAYFSVAYRAVKAGGFYLVTPL
ncbi:hypothetical protein Pisl_0643 [Pyrobaculum islandicum DSM 4184]|uniref:Uncharacterized protein n=1 Tax=Pyrobaculum islandicum (strain DSM 4184 / JCM 9189 / GEO3) TaxID=384616 RepID=A1RS89_PYRIL|nr:hypothetical protein [Pyrobaculum islandicum]ABL87821.1 hypothetical protein Pisl_0643 [Pyrobaculum islandicum DSM 4184]